MQIYGLTGPSGAGKSTSALPFAYKENIPAIIDDGLLIVHGKRISGTSAKFEKNMITAVKRATFYYQDHSEEIQKAIRLHAIDKILLIGTSVKMVDLIASRLQLGEVDDYIDIKDVRESSEIKLAMFTRNTKGNHLMPIPFNQVEQSFFKRIITQGVKIFSPKKEVIGETTIVRPNFHKDSLIIHDQVFKKIVFNACTSVEEVVSCEKVHIQLEGLPLVKVEITLNYYQTTENVIGILKEIQQKISKDFNSYLNLELYSIDVHVLKLA